MTKQLVSLAAGVMTTLLALVVLWQFRIVVVYVLISLMFAAAVRPLVNRLAGRRWGARAARILLYLAALGSFGYLLTRTAEAAINEIQDVASGVSVQDVWRLPVWLEGSAFQKVVLERLPPLSKLFEAITGDQGQLVLPALLGFTQNIGILVSGVIIVLLLGIYWSSNQVHFERLWLSLLPPGQRKQARDIWRTIELDTGAYIRGQIIHSILVGLLLGLGFWLSGSPSPAFLALAGALSSLIPMVGITLAVIITLITGLLTSLQLSLITGAYALIILIALGIWVKPRIFDHKWDNPILTIILLIALQDVFGLVGLIAAPPVSVVCQILWSHLVSRRAVEGAAVQVSDLKERQERVSDIIEAMDEPPIALVTNSMRRLALLIEKAEPVLQAGLLAESSNLFQAPEPASVFLNKGNEANDGHTQNP